MTSNLVKSPAFATDYEGFAVVRRLNNPLRAEALVHRSLGKIGGVDPVESRLLAARLALKSGFPKGWPVIGLSESSILLGRLVAEHHQGGSFIYSTRHPEPGMVPFDEPHSHAPAHYLKISELQGTDQVCIVEDEISSGNTVMNLLRVLVTHLPELKRVHMIALKVLCSDRRIHEMKDRALLLGIELTMGWLYHEHGRDYEALEVWPNPQARLNAADQPGLHDTWEIGRGRLEAFRPDEAHRRYMMWQESLEPLSISGPVVTVGASEAIDLAFEISDLFSQRNRSSFRHFTISPWDLPGWSFEQKGMRNLHLYSLPLERACYILVYDQKGQKEQVISLGENLMKGGSRVIVMSHQGKVVSFEELD